MTPVGNAWSLDTPEQSSYENARREAEALRFWTNVDTPSRMLVLDTEPGKEIAPGETAGESDDLDSRRGRIYVLTAAGFIEVFQDRDHNHYDRLRVTRRTPHPNWAVRSRMEKTFRCCATTR
jgi:hypothetical protein